MKILLVGLEYLEHNYGAQAIAIPLMEKISNHLKNVKYSIALWRNVDKKKCIDIESVIAPNPFLILAKTNVMLFPFLLLVGRKKLSEEKTKYAKLVNILKACNLIIDVSGIEFVPHEGSSFASLKRRYVNFLKIISMQKLAGKYRKIYLKYTKSYGPFSYKDKLYKLLVKSHLNKLPFLFVRGRQNLKEIKKLKLSVPTYSFPDISISVEPYSRDWALDYLSKLGVDCSRKIGGLSPSSVIFNMKTQNNTSCGLNHLKLCKQIINFYRSNGLQVLLIPHSVYDGKNIRRCDLALTKKIYQSLKNKEDVFLIDDINLTYKHVKAIIGLLDFYVTARYHSLSSALSMAIPVVALSWHMKYADIMSYFLEDFLVIDCKATSVEKALQLIKKYFYDRKWFDKERILSRKNQAIKEINRSILMLVNFIKSNIGNCSVDN